MIKRILDVIVASIALLALVFLFLYLIWKIRREMGGSAFFFQTRPGLGGRPFRMIKFRSMSDERGPDGQLLPDAERLSSFGKFLRASSLDELPELVNVLRGEMSLVGPRPLLMDYLPLYSDRQSRRHEVRPGITGWAQVNGRNALSWEEKFEFDVLVCRPIVRSGSTLKSYGAPCVRFWCEMALMRLIAQRCRDSLVHVEINNDLPHFCGSTEQAVMAAR